MIKLVQDNSKSTRFHSFGIGDGASPELVKGVAKAGRGNFYFINDNESYMLQEKVIDALSKTGEPTLGDFTFEFTKPCVQ